MSLGNVEGIEVYLNRIPFIGVALDSGLYLCGLI